MAHPLASAAESGDSTTGTASTVSPSTVAVGGTLTYTLSGFPPGATIQISVDDGMLSAQEAIGAATINKDGVTSGAVELPGYVAKGSHWLRFDVSAGRDIPTNEVRTLDYTNKSPYFTVGDVTIIGGSATTSATASESAPAADSTPFDSGAADSATAGSETAGAETGDSRTTQVEIVSGGRETQPAVEIRDSTFPYVGASLFLLALLLVLLAAAVVLNRRRRAAREMSGE
ncbi:hypothetical protein OHJ16_03470 [Actinomyces israelii]|uniref:DNA-directed RNA polymerase II n=1 Tax=Actinomyces israelii TaxID=1659 RepID=A0ABT4I5U0_9ACTO|nr:hypothetical protein [Actinomyces israelii]MCZ0857107.1 hypothetical protein [Actinomyces israelii]